MEEARTSEGEQGETDAVRQKLLVVDVRAVVCVLEGLPRDVADDSAEGASEGDLVKPGRDNPVLERAAD